MSAYTKVTYGAKKYLVTWHSRTKAAIEVAAWQYEGTTGYWRTVWAPPRPMGSIVAAVVALANQKRETR